MESPIRILQIVTKMDRAGLETMLMNYYRHIDRNKVQFDFLTHRSEYGAYDDEIQRLGGRIYHTYPISSRYLIRYLRELKQFFKEHPEYKIVHSHLDALSAYPLYAAKKTGVPVRIAHSHTTNFDKDFKLPFRYISKVLVPLFATDFWGCSREAIEFMFGKKIDKSVIIPNAIDVEKYKYDENIRRSVRDNLRISDKFVVGHIGRFTYPKNHEFLIDIFMEIHKINPNSILMLVGDGEERARIQRKVNLLGIQENVFFMGVRSDIPNLIQAMDVFVFPSRFEGLGIVLIEAQAAGLPCIASKDVIPKEVRVSNRVQFVPLNSTSTEWAQKVLRYEGVNCESRVCQLTNNGYDIQKEAKAMCDIYLRMLKKTH